STRGLTLTLLRSAATIAACLRSYAIMSWVLTLSRGRGAVWGAVGACAFGPVVIGTCTGDRGGGERVVCGDGGWRGAAAAPADGATVGARGCAALGACAGRGDWAGGGGWGAWGGSAVVRDGVVGGAAGRAERAGGPGEGQGA